MKILNMSAIKKSLLLKNNYVKSQPSHSTLNIYYPVNRGKLKPLSYFVNSHLLKTDTLFNLELLPFSSQMKTK